MDVIYLIGENRELVPMIERRYESEDLLQRLLAEFPQVLAGHTTDSDAHRWLFVEREVPLPDEPGGHGRWAMDHLFIDEAAIPTLVEVKRSSDTRARREVAGQMLDYAANTLLHLPASRMRALFEARCASEGIDAEALLDSHTGGLLDAETFWERVQANLEDRRLRLVFVADAISTELQRIIEFLGPQMNRTRLLAIEVKQYVGPEGRPQTLVPRIIGQTIASEEAKADARGPARSWDRESFIAALSESSPALVSAFERLMRWAVDAGAGITYGAGRAYGTARIRIAVPSGGDFQLFALTTAARLEILFSQYPAPFDSHDSRLDLIQRLNAASGTQIPESRAETHTFTDAGVLASAPGLEGFIATFEDVVARIRADAGSLTA